MNLLRFAGFAARGHRGPTLLESPRGFKDGALSYFVYLLVSDGGTHSYVGWTTDLDKRLAQHNAGKGARSTRGRCWFLAYAECHPTRRSAMSREWHLKRDRDFRKAVRDRN